MELERIDLTGPIWDHFYLVHPLVLVGTMEPDGSHDLAPKHMAMPLSWADHFGFVCSKTHRTWQNATRTGAFTVSYPRADQTVLASLAASPRCDDGAKPALAAIEVEPAQEVEGVLVRGCDLHLECRLERTVDDLGPNSLIIGRVVAVWADPGIVRRHDVDDADLLHAHPRLAYLYPDRFASIDATNHFPFHQGFKR